MEQGWVKLHRQLIENPIITKPSYLALWVVLLLKANHKENKFMWNGNIIVVKEGQMITGRKELSKETKIPESTIEDILNYLEKQHQIQQQKTTKYRLITIVNWVKYQGSDTKSNNKATTKQQQADTNKNDNNIKNEKKINTDETSSSEITLLIKSFETLNPASKRFYGNTTQRKACSDLIETYGLERVQNVVEKTLPKTNTIQYFPSITTPLQLFEKWATLESKIKQYQSEKITSKEKYKII
jgi:hypothetical protein